MLVLLSIYLFITTIIFNFVYKAQPTPFIDEIFHIPQAQKYCNGSFSEWDPKITTLPGLYIASVILFVPLSWLNEAWSCSTWCLRYTNVLCNCANVVLCFYILKKLHMTKNSSSSVSKVDASDELLHYKLTSFCIGCFPLLYFYSFLYYTDPGSVTFVLAMYLAALHDRDVAAALLGAAAVVFRQNNIVWVVFAAGVKVVHFMEVDAGLKKVEVSPELKDELARFFATLLLAVIRYLLVLENCLRVLRLVWPYCACALAFAAFVVANDGIVVGDRASHEVGFHLAQLLYFSLVTLAFSAPTLITRDKLRRFVAFAQRNPATCVALLCAAAYCVANHSRPHPYLLADNRHYAFYLWRRVWGKPPVRYLLLPAYVYAAWSINDSLVSAPRSRSLLWRAGYALCLAAALVPQRLLEFRYFVLPYLVFRLHVARARWCVVEMAVYAAVNAFTVFVFLRKTVRWEDLAEPQRIIW